jgi:hypothetical protein
MTTFTTISTGSLAVDKPVTSSLAIALRDNPIAIAEAAPSAPIIQQAWHPYNKATNGDANTGVIYNASVSGAVASLVTPDFVDGFEYRLILYRMGHSDAATSALRFELFGETSGAYMATVVTLANVTATLGRAQGTVDLPVVRSTLLNHFYDVHAGFAAASGNIAVPGSGEKVLKARISFAAGNINAGIIWLHRRQAFPLTT